MIYRRLSFEDDLFTARVYKRNYRTPMLLRLLKNRTRRIPGSITPIDVVGQDYRGSYNESRPNCVISKSSTLGGRVQATNSEVSFVERPTMKPAPGWLLRTNYRDPAYIGLDKTFMSACEQGDHHTVQAFLKMAYDMRPQQQYPSPYAYFGALDAAVTSGHGEVVLQLLKYGDSKEAPTAIKGCGSLHIAASSDNASMIKFLLANGADIKASNKLREQPIHTAIKYGSIEALHVLVEGGAALDCSDKDGRQPLHWAAESSDQPKVIEFLVSHGADVNAPTKVRDNIQSYERPLEMACRQDLVGNVRALLALGADTKGQYSDLAFLVRHDPLSTAIRHRSLGALETLLKHDTIDPNRPGHAGIPALHLAVNLIQEDGPINERLVLLLIRYQANVNTQDKYGDTALHYVTRKWKWGHSSTAILAWANILLDNDADPNALNKDGRTPLYWATKGHQMALIMRLIEKGARLVVKEDEHSLMLRLQGVMTLNSIKNLQFELQWHAGPFEHNGEKNRIIESRFHQIAIRLMKCKIPLAREGMIITLESRATPGSTQTLVREEIQVHSRSIANETRRFDGEAPATKPDAIRSDGGVNITPLGASRSAESINFTPSVVPTRASLDVDIAYVSGAANRSEGAESDSDPSLPPLGTSSPVS